MGEAPGLKSPGPLPRHPASQRLNMYVFLNVPNMAAMLEATVFPVQTLGACAAEGIEAKLAKTEDRAVIPRSPGSAPGRRR